MAILMTRYHNISAPCSSVIIDLKQCNTICPPSHLQLIAIHNATNVHNTNTHVIGDEYYDPPTATNRSTMAILMMNLHDTSASH